MRTKRAFVPSSLGGMDRLEDRVVLSGGVIFVKGAAILTSHAYSKTASEIKQAFTRFATKGLNYGQLQADLVKATNRIPYHRAGGLDDTTAGIVSQLRDDIASKVDRPVIGAYRAMLSALKDHVASGVSNGSIARR